MANGLKEIRESCGLKLEDISRATCICSRYLEAIEEGDFSKIPADVYALGYIRGYANYLGVPLPEAFKEYKTYLENNSSVVKNGSIVKRKNFLQILSSIFLAS